MLMSEEKKSKINIDLSFPTTSLSDDATKHGNTGEFTQIDKHELPDIQKGQSPASADNQHNFGNQSDSSSAISPTLEFDAPLDSPLATPQALEFDTHDDSPLAMSAALEFGAQASGDVVDTAWDVPIIDIPSEQEALFGESAAAMEPSQTKTEVISSHDSAAMQVFAAPHVTTTSDTAEGEYNTAAATGNADASSTQIMQNEQSTRVMQDTPAAQAPQTVRLSQTVPSAQADQATRAFDDDGLFDAAGVSFTPVDSENQSQDANSGVQSAQKTKRRRFKSAVWL